VERPPLAPWVDLAGRPPLLAHRQPPRAPRASSTATTTTTTLHREPTASLHVRRWLNPEVGEMAALEVGARMTPTRARGPPPMGRRGRGGAPAEETGSPRRSRGRAVPLATWENSQGRVTTP
jgi:hypothetical protein